VLYADFKVHAERELVSSISYGRISLSLEYDNIVENINPTHGVTPDTVKPDCP
jgi:hypothetical protein